MKLFVTRIVASAAMLVAAPGWAQEPQPRIMPVPSWVVVPEMPAIDSSKADGPVQFLLSSSQENILPDGTENYVHYAVVPQTIVGLQAIGNVMIPWDVDRSDLLIHRIAIRRGEEVIDLLQPQDLMVLRRENNLERAMLDGIRTVVVPARGLQLGDVLDVAVSYKIKPSSILTRPDEVQSLSLPLHQGLVERRFLVPDTVTVNWKVSPSIEPAKVTRHDGFSEYRFVQMDLAPPVIPSNAPGRYVQPVIQLSGYSDWSEVSGRLRPLFDVARQSPAQGSLMAAADKIAAASSDPALRMLAALRLAQEQVRYVALLLGEGAYVPASADETWERKFGDCKGKTALLLSLLDRLGIASEPLLVSSGNNDRLEEALPSLLLFDHVMVRATIDGKKYYLDPTGYGERTLEELTGTPFRNGLPLRQQAQLERLPAPELTVPLREATITWDYAQSPQGKVPFHAVLALRGVQAAEMRASLAGASDMKSFDSSLKQLVPGIHNDDLNIVEKVAEAPDGSFVVLFNGNAEMDWSPNPGERKSRWAFSQSTLNWTPSFDRAEGPGKDWPVLLSERPYWERTIETVILPNGGKGYSVDAEPIQKKLAGSFISRTIAQAGDKVTMVADFKHLEREISAAEARAAEPLLNSISESYANIVGPRARKPQRH
jgi:hypothetical protein